MTRMLIPVSEGLKQSPGLALEKKILHFLADVFSRSRVVSDKSVYISQKVKDRTVLDLGCVGLFALFGESRKETWLHSVICQEAKVCLGVDCMEEETRVLQEQGWNIICQDITKMELGQTFQTVVAADVIEHLTNFDGFFQSVARHLAPEGELIISTPNPLGFVHSFYTAVRGRPLVHPDHNCWFDPKCLIQLAQRYGFVPVELAWIRNSWLPSYFLLHGTDTFGVFDFFTGYWSPAPTWLRFLRAGLQRIVLSPLNLLLRCLCLRKYMSSDYVMVFRRESQ